MEAVCFVPLQETSNLGVKATTVILTAIRKGNNNLQSNYSASFIDYAN